MLARHLPILTRCARPLRRFCSSRPQDPAKPPAAICFAAGLAGGTLGGLVGLGGGVVMIPIMAARAGMTQHQAVATSSAAVAATGLSGCLSYYTTGAVDFACAAAIAVTAMAGARLGARLTARFDPVQLQRSFAIFQMLVAPMVPLKGALVRSSKKADPDAPTKATVGLAYEPPPLRGRESELLKLAAAGLSAGVASGMFGIGGGVLITPMLCLFTDLPYVVVLGTTLASMVPPSLVSAATHHGMGNLQVAAIAPLCLGSAIGAGMSAQLAVLCPSEEVLQLLFAVMVFGMGGQKFLVLRGK